MNEITPSFDGLTVLVSHPWMSFGGSEATVMWAIQALQKKGAVITLITASDFDVTRFNRTYGTEVDEKNLQIIRSKRFPGLNNGFRLANWQNSLFQRQCRRFSNQFDLLISGYNLIDFGRPGIQLIGDYTWSENLRIALDPDAERLPRHRNHWVRRWYLAIGKWLCGPETAPITERGDLVLANSEWTREIFADQVDLHDCAVLFPPVSFHHSPHAESETPERDPFAFVCVGRISLEKRIESVIHILSRVRDFGYPVTLTIAGGGQDADYGKQIETLVAANDDWARMTGFLEPNARDALLASASFGIHARPAEAFGIAVAEMAGSGCLPFVPDQGGPAEIVGVPELRFRDEDDAVAKIVAVLSNPCGLDELRSSLIESVKRFLPDHFSASFLREVSHFLNRDRNPNHAELPRSSAHPEIQPIEVSQTA